MTEKEEFVRAIIAPIKLKYFPRETSEFAERAFRNTHRLAEFCLELLGDIESLERRISELEKKQTT